MVDAENVLISMPHPRTKGSTGFPDAIKDRDYFNDPHYQGFGLRWGMGLDGSEKRTCEYRCLPLLDDMSNWVADRPEPLKYAISISEVRHQQPGDDLYAGSPVTYVHLQSFPPATDPSPVIDALMKGDMFITTGEVLVPKFRLRVRATNAPLWLTWSGPFRWIWSRSCGATARRPAGRSFPRQICRRSALTISRFPLMRRARNGSASRPGIRLMKAQSSSRSVWDRRRRKIDRHFLAQRAA